MSKLTNLLCASAAGIFASNAAFAIVNKDLRIRTSLVSGDNRYAYDLSVVGEHAGFSSKSLSEPRHEAHKVWADLLVDLSELGEVTNGVQTGMHLQSFRVKLNPLRPGSSLLGSLSTPTRPQEMEAAYAFSELYKSKADLILENPESAGWVEIIRGRREDFVRLAVCVGFDYKAHVEGSIKLPAFVQRSMNSLCETTASVAPTLNMMLDLTSENTFQPDEDQLKTYEVSKYLSLASLKYHAQLCSNIAVPSASDVIDLKAAGWISQSATTREEIQSQCQSFVDNNVLADLSAIFDATLSTVPLNKSITPYHRRLLTDLLEAHKAELYQSKEELDQKVKTKISVFFNKISSVSKAEIESNDFNIEEFGEALDSGKDLSPDEFLHILFASKAQATSPFLLELKKRPVTSQLQFVQDMKLAIAKECDFTQFNPMCLLQGVYGIGQNQYQISSFFGEELLFKGVKLAPPVQP